MIKEILSANSLSFLAFRSISLGYLLTLTTAQADITVSPGNTDPVYPAAMPDPWMVSTLDLEGNFFTVNLGSQVIISDTLFANGRIVLQSGGLIDAAETALITEAGGTASAGAIFISDATMNAGSISLIADTALFLQIDDGGLFTLDSPSLIAQNSTVVIETDDGAQFTSSADVTFGQDNSSFSLGALTSVSTDESASIDGTDAGANAANTALVTVAKARAADAAMDAIATVNSTGSADPTIANEINFFVDGDFSTGGASSDSLVHLGPGSRFEVTGDANFVPGFGSIANFVILGDEGGVGVTEFIVGNDWAVTRDGSSSTTAFVFESTIDVGNDWLFGGGSISNNTLTISDSTVTVGGTFDNTLRNSSANELTIEESTFTTVGDFLFAGVPGDNSGSAATMTVSDSTLTGMGNFRSVLGADSAFSTSIADSQVDFGGDFTAQIIGGNSVQVATFDGTSITANNFTLGVDGDNSSQTFTFETTVFDLAGGFEIVGPGDMLDSTVQMLNTSGTVDGDFRFGGGGISSTTAIVINQFDVEIGGDLRFEIPALSGSESQLFIANFTPDVTGNVLFDVARSPGATSTTFIADVDLVAGGDVTITQNTFASMSGTARVGGTFFNFGNFTPVSGENFIIDADNLSTFSPATNDDIYVGPTGAATLEVDQGGTVNASGITLGALGSGVGTLNLNGAMGLRGAVILPDLVEGLGTGLVNFDGGIYRTTAVNPSLFSSFEPGDILFNAGGAFIDTNSFDMTTAYPFAGVGGLTKLGEGTLTLNGTSVYIGGTTVEAGALFAGIATALPQNTPYTVNGGTLDLNDFSLTASELSGTGGTVDLGAATLTVDQVTNTSFAGGIIGAGALVKQSGGTLTLSGTNTFTGGTTVEDGTLQAGSAGAFPQNTVYTVNGGTLDLNNFDLTASEFSGTGGVVDLGAAIFTVHQTVNTVFDGVITGAGQLVKDGSGTLTLNGANDYTGGTTVEDGTLLAGTAVGFPQNTPYTVNGGILDLNDFDLTASELSGTGGIVDLGAATLTIDQAVNTDFAGEITGTGGLIKDGIGGLTLSGINAYTGDTAVDGGTLFVNGSIASADTFVSPGGTLGGIGTIGGNVFNDGIVSPGLSPGVLTILGDYTQTANGVYLVELASVSNFDQLAVGGSANLGGTIRVNYLGGFVPSVGQRYEVVTAAGGVNGVFSTLEQPVSPVRLGVIYEPNAAVLFVEGSQFVPFFDLVADVVAQAPADRPQAQSASQLLFTGLTPNQRSVAGALDTTSVNDPGQRALFEFLFDRPINALPTDFDRIAPEELGAIFEVMLSTSEVYGSTLTRRLRNVRAGSTGFSNRATFHGAKTPIETDPYAKTVVTDKMPVIYAPTPDNPWGIWTSGSGDFIDIDSDGNGSGFDFETAGVSAGIDYRAADNLIVGVAGSYFSTDTDLIEKGDLELDGVRGSFYGTWFGENAFLNAAVGGGYHDFDTRRRGLDRKFVRGSSDGVTFDAQVDVGYDVNFERFTIGPIASLAYTHASIDSFRELGSLVPLEIFDQNEESLRSRIGLRLASRFDFGDLALIPELRTEYEREFLDDNRSIGAGFVNDPSGRFVVETPGLGRDAAIIGAGLGFHFRENASGYFGYEGEFGRDNFQRHTLQVGFGINF